MGCEFLIHLLKPSGYLWLSDGLLMGKISIRCCLCVFECVRLLEPPQAFNESDVIWFSRIR